MEFIQALPLSLYLWIKDKANIYYTLILFLKNPGNIFRQRFVISACNLNFFA